MVEFKSLVFSILMVKFSFAVIFAVLSFVNNKSPDDVIAPINVCVSSDEFPNAVDPEDTLIILSDTMYD